MTLNKTYKIILMGKMMIISLAFQLSELNAGELNCEPVKFIETMDLSLEYFKVLNVRKGAYFGNNMQCYILIGPSDSYKECRENFGSKYSRYLSFKHHVPENPGYEYYMSLNRYNRIYKNVSLLRKYELTNVQLPFSYTVSNGKISDIKTVVDSADTFYIPRPDVYSSQHHSVEKPEEIFSYLTRYMPQVCRLADMGDNEFSLEAEKLIKENEDVSIRLSGNELPGIDYNKLENYERYKKRGN